MDKLYADVIVDISQGKLDRTFQYEIPDELYHEIKIGSRECASLLERDRGKLQDM